MKSIPKYVDGITQFKASDLNEPLYAIESQLAQLESQKQTENIFLSNQQIAPSVINNRVVCFNGSAWDTLTSLNVIGELFSRFPMGIVDTGKRIVYSNGLVRNLSSDIIDGEFNIGKPYYLSGSQPGKITTFQSTSPIYVGQFVNSKDFLLNMHPLVVSHIHRRTLLNPTKWLDMGSYLLYPIIELGQLPLPFNGVVLVMQDTYMPHYGPYQFDTEGIKITDISYIETLIGSSGLYATISSASYIIEAFWSDPRTISVPGVMSLKSGTENIIITNNIPGQPSDVGSLTVKNIPVVQNIEILTPGSLVVKSFSANIVTGRLETYSGQVVESIVAGSNIYVDQNQGRVTISSTANKIVQEEFQDVFLQGALSKLYPNTINTYIEFPNTRSTSAIYKYVLPSSVDTTSLATIVIKYVGIGASSDVQVPLRVYYKCVMYKLDESPDFIEVSVKPMLDISELVLVTLPVQSSKMVYVKIERNSDIIFSYPIGILSCSISYKKEA